jgi:hypothetical protein
MVKIAFGTGDWRGIIGKEFTLENVRTVQQLIATFMVDHSLDDPTAGSGSWQVCSHKIDPAARSQGESCRIVGLQGGRIGSVNLQESCNTRKVLDPSLLRFA